MIWYKSCPKCHRGDLMLERDLVGYYRQCLQCGYMQDVVKQQTAKATPVLLSIKPVERTAQGAKAA